MGWNTICAGSALVPRRLRPHVFSPQLFLPHEANADDVNLRGRGHRHHGYKRRHLIFQTIIDDPLWKAIYELKRRGHKFSNR